VTSKTDQRIRGEDATPRTPLREAHTMAEKVVADYNIQFISKDERRPESQDMCSWPEAYDFCSQHILLSMSTENICQCKICKAIREVLAGRLAAREDVDGARKTRTLATCNGHSK
jgi:hypothetical protein